jgi:hypothetical protein
MGILSSRETGMRKKFPSRVREDPHKKLYHRGDEDVELKSDGKFLIATPSHEENTIRMKKNIFL